MVNSSNSHNRKEPPPRLPRNVKLLGAASLLNDVASEMIYLRGRLPSYYQKQLAQEAVAKLPGISGIVNQAEVVHDGF